MVHSGCPSDPEDVAELYLLRHLSPVEAQAFEDHYLGCTNCAAALEVTERYILAMKRASARLRSESHVRTAGG